LSRQTWQLQDRHFCQGSYLFSQFSIQCDPFIVEMLPFISQLNGMQMSSILTQVRDLTLRPRRTA
jgi:hypothetical protein